MRNHITRPERALLTVAVAQKTVGQGRTPSARDLRRAHDEAGCAVARRGVAVVGGTVGVDRFIDRCCEGLSGISGMAGDELGSFWSSVKTAVTKAANVATPFMPFVGPTATLAPIAKNLLIPPRRARPPEESQDDNTQEVAGSFIGGEPISSAYDDAEIELMRGEGMGTSELAAMWRRRGRRARPHISVSGGIPHEIYRAAIVQRARRLAGGRQPMSKHFAAAQATVDRDLAQGGASVFIPGARPGRVTR